MFLACLHLFAIFSHVISQTYSVSQTYSASRIIHIVSTPAYSEQRNYLYQDHKKNHVYHVPHDSSHQNQAIALLINKRMCLGFLLIKQRIKKMFPQATQAWFLKQAKLISGLSVVSENTDCNNFKLITLATTTWCAEVWKYKMWRKPKQIDAYDSGSLVERAAT